MSDNKDTGNKITSSNSIHVVSALRDHGNYTLGTLLTAVEAALGDSKQAEALKAIVRREMFALMDRNQGEIYTRTGEQRTGVTPVETWVDNQDYLKEQKEYEKANQ